MIDDTLDDAESGRPKRAAPTLDLAANDQPRDPPIAAAEPDDADLSRRPGFAAPIAAGALAGALVAGLAWFAASTWLTATPEPQPSTVGNVNAARIEELGARLAKVETRPAPVAPAPDLSAITARLEALDGAAAALRAENAALRAQSAQALSAAGAAQDAAKANAGGETPDLSALTARMTQLETASQSQIAKIAEQSRKPADDSAIRRVAIAALLDAQVRAGEPFTAALNAAKALAPDGAKLAPLQPFAATGVPSANVLARELLAMPEVTPPATATSGGLIDRIRSGATKLVKIERTDGAGADSAIFARAADAARRDDLAGAAKELAALPPAERAAVQPWLDRVAAREAARAASRQFAAEAVALPQAASQ